MTLAFSFWWVVGWVIGFGGAVVAAVLLVAIIRLAGRIAGQADDITDALEGARANTAPLFDLAETNLSLDQSARAVGRLGSGGGPAPGESVR